MLQTMDEIKKAEMNPGMIINGVDNPNLESVDSTTPIITDADKVKPEDSTKEENKPAEEVKAEVKEEVKSEEVKSEATDEAVKSSAENTESDKKEKEVTDELKDPVEKRIGKLTKKWRTTERERDYERNKRLEAEAELEKLKALIPATDKPKREDFEDDESYFESLADWKIESKLRAKEAVVEKKSSEEIEKRAASEVEQEIEDIADRGRDKYNDFATTVFDKDLVLTQAMVEAIIPSDIAEEVLYYLGKNPDVSAAIGEMSPMRAAKEIWKIEEKLGAESVTPKAVAPVKKLTNTPEPIVPPRGTGAVDKDPNQMSPKEYRAWRERNKG